jgi:hypothetical protein
MQVVRIERDIPAMSLLDSLPDNGLLPAWLVPVGGAEGADSIWRPVTVWMNLPPGRYMLLCRITTPDQKPHYTLGMQRALVAVGSQQVDFAANNTGDSVLTLSDYSISAPDTLSAGKVLLRVHNAGPSEHNVAVARLRAGKTLSDVVLAPPGMTPVFEVLGGTAGLAPGQENVLEFDLQPGLYVYLCFVLDPRTGKEHYALGMARLLRVIP